MEHRSKVVEELHKPARRNYPRRKVDIRGIDETWQADLVDMHLDAKQNNGHHYILTVIDVFSKYAWAIPIKQKTGSDVTTAMEKIFQEGRVPKHICVDRGLEFYNNHFKNLMKKHKSLLNL